MILKIIGVTDGRLRTVSKPVQKIDRKTLLLIKDLEETLKIQKDPEGIGLAAPQVGKNLRIFVMRRKNSFQIIINPEILKKSENKPKKSKKHKGPRIMEGCLSLPHYYGPIVREKMVELRYTTVDGSEIVETFLGIEAQIVLHEIDHLNGVLFVDRLLEQKRPLYEYHNGEWDEVEL